MEEPAAITMTSLLTDISTFITQFVKWVGEVVTMVSTNPLLLLVTGIMIFGAAIGIFGRLLSRG